MTTLTIKLPGLHEAQKPIALDSHRFIVVSAGRRFGKTRLGVVKCVRAGLSGKRAWWTAPNYPLGAVGWRLSKWLARQIPRTVIRESVRMIEYPGGGTSQVKSADHPDSLRSEGLDLVVVDETAHIPKFSEVWEQALRPALSDRKGGALFISTPKGFNHFCELYKRAEERDDWAAYQHPTWDNPYIDPGEIEIARLELPSLIFRQEYGAEFVQLAGALFGRDWWLFIEKAPQIRYVRYWDLAASTKTSADFTVGAKIGLTDKGFLVIADVVRGRWEWPDALRVIGDTARMDGPGVQQGIEGTGTQKGMYQMVIREPSLAGLAFRPIEVQKDKLTRAMPFLARAEQKRVMLVRGAWNKDFIDETCAFPETEHDDQVDTVSGAMQMLMKAPGIYFL